MNGTTQRKTPVRDLADSLDKHLQRQNYSAETLGRHCRPLWRKLADYAEANGYETVDAG